MCELSGVLSHKLNLQKSTLDAQSPSPTAAKHPIYFVFSLSSLSLMCTRAPSLTEELLEVAISYYYSLILFLSPKSSFGFYCK